VFIVWLPGIANGLMYSPCCTQPATYLGHVHLGATQRYLTMTPEPPTGGPANALNVVSGRSPVDKAMLLGSRIRRFLLEHLVAERNLAHNTQRSYRDTLV
jgi:hypothetical protein